MKLSDEERAEYPSSMMASQPLYPYGLCISLESDSMEKLGLKLPELDQVIEFKVKAQVTSLNSRKSGNDEEDSCISLQITGMEVVDSGKETAEKLYKDMK